MYQYTITRTGPLAARVDAIDLTNYREPRVWRARLTDDHRRYREVTVVAYSRGGALLRAYKAFRLWDIIAGRWTLNVWPTR